MPVDEVSWVTTHDWSREVDHAHLEWIRSRPDHYAPGGLLHLVLEVVAYADDEARELGRTGACEIVLSADGSVSVADDGRGTDTRRTPAGRIVRKPVMATRDLRYFDAADPELLPDGYPRRGMSVVAALSDWLLHTNRRSDGAWEQRYEAGVPVAELRELEARGRGTTVGFRANPGLLTMLDADQVQQAARFASLGVRCRTA